MIINFVLIFSSNFRFINPLAINKRLKTQEDNLPESPSETPTSTGSKFKLNLTTSNKMQQVVEEKNPKTVEYLSALQKKYKKLVFTPIVKET